MGCFGAGTLERPPPTQDSSHHQDCYIFARGFICQLASGVPGGAFFRNWTRLPKMARSKKGQNYWAKKKCILFLTTQKNIHPWKLTWQRKKTTVWRCISYKKLSCSIAMLVLGAAGLHINRSKKGTGSWVYPNHSKWSEGTSNIGLLRQSPAFTSGRGCFIGILTISPTYSSIIPRPTG